MVRQGLQKRARQALQEVQRLPLLREAQGLQVLPRRRAGGHHWSEDFSEQEVRQAADQAGILQTLPAELQTALLRRGPGRLPTSTSALGQEGPLRG